MRPTLRTTVPLPKKTTHNADCVISVSKGVSDLLFLDPLQRREIVTNGFDPDDVLFRKRDIDQINSKSLIREPCTMKAMLEGI